MSHTIAARNAMASQCPRAFAYLVHEVLERLAALGADEALGVPRALEGVDAVAFDGRVAPLARGEVLGLGTPLAEEFLLLVVHVAAQSLLALAADEALLVPLQVLRLLVALKHANLNSSQAKPNHQSVSQSITSRKASASAPASVWREAAQGLHEQGKQTLWKRRTFSPTFAPHAAQLSE